MSGLPLSIRRNPELDRWVAVEPDGTLVVRSGKVELGQGLRTALTLIAADELEVAPSRIRLEAGDTERAPDELVTAGSTSIEDGGAALRQACAWARRVLLERAARALDAPLETLAVDDGEVRAPGSERSVGYAALAAEGPFALSIAEPAPEKPASAHRWVGRGMPRVDLPAKARGEPAFVHDLRAEGMLHARVVRPARPGARVVDGGAAAAAAEREPGVHAVVRDGAFLAVLAEREEDAERAAERARRRLSTAPAAPLPAELQRHLREHEASALLVVDGTPVDDPIPPRTPPADAAAVHEAVYTRPFQMHAALGPSAALARWEAGGPREGRLTVQTHSQGVGLLRLALATALGIEAGRIRVVHVEGAGCYGHNGADDVALDAALAARAVPGRPVLAKWTRADEHRYEPYAPAMRCELAAALDAKGRIAWWSHDVWSYTHLARPIPDPEGRVNLRAAWERATPLAPPPVAPMRAPHGGLHRNADPLYALPERRVVKRLAAPSPLRTSSTRSLGAYANVFAIESFMDELAAAAGRDPVAFRLAHLEDARARAVIERAGALAAASPRPAPRPGVATGRGLGFARYKNRQSYAAVIAEATVDERRAAPRVARLWIAADAGRVVDPDGLANQLEGGAVQATSWTLKEAVHFDAGAVTSVDWESYPILRFDEVPEVETALVDRADAPSVGAGEAAQGPTAAAIANAVADATGLRVRDLPITPEALRAAASR